MPAKSHSRHVRLVGCVFYKMSQIAPYAFDDHDIELLRRMGDGAIREGG